jgi:hypothetical protein
VTIVVAVVMMICSEIKIGRLCRSLLWWSLNRSSPSL